MKVIFMYFTLINLAAFIIMGIDKRKAQRHRWRISEGSLFLVGLLGGGAGVLLGMSFFHHKTRHLKFTLGIPAVIIANIAVFWYIINRFFLN